MEDLENDDHRTDIVEPKWYLGGFRREKKGHTFVSSEDIPIDP
jgi:hypothetical protein